jgi:hypothetical protein
MKIVANSKFARNVAKAFIYHAEDRGHGKFTIKATDIPFVLITAKGSLKNGS